MQNYKVYPLNGLLVFVTSMSLRGAIIHYLRRSHITKNGQPSEELISLSLTAMDAFASGHDIIHKVEYLMLFTGINGC